MARSKKVGDSSEGGKSPAETSVDQAPAYDTFATAEPGTAYETFADALDAAGPFGPHQMWFLALIQLGVLLWCGNTAFMSYATLKPSVTCHLPDNSSLLLNKTSEQLFCALKANGSCSLSWEAPFKTITEEWELICDQAWIPETINSAQMAGSGVALAVSGVAADALGRKWVTLASFAVLFASMVASILAPGALWFAATRFFAGASLYTSASCSFVWAMELSDAPHNVLVNCAFLWQFAYVACGAIGFLLPDWRNYSWAIIGLSSPLLAYPWVFGESPRWLLQKGRLDEAAAELSRIARRNRPAARRPTFHPASLALVHKEEGQEPVTKDPWAPLRRVIGLFSTARLAAFTLTLIIVDASAIAAQFAFVFGMTNFAGQPSLKFVVFGLVRLWQPFLLVALDRKWRAFGRRSLLMWPLALVTASYLLLPVFEVVDVGPWPPLIALFFGATIVNIVFVAHGQFTCELYPTPVRNTAKSYASVAQPFVSVLLPQLFLASSASVPYLFTAALSGLALLLGLALLPVCSHSSRDIYFRQIKTLMI